MQITAIVVDSDYFILLSYFFLLFRFTKKEVVKKSGEERKKEVALRWDVQSRLNERHLSPID